jgi:glycosyltransferase involved in cell wall biosynthesis
MAERVRVGLFYSYNEKWIGGTYYRLNLIHALNTLDDDVKPVIVLMTDSEENIAKVRSETGYPYIDHINLSHQLSLPKRAINFVGGFFGIRPFNRQIKNPNVDMVYPNYKDNIVGKKLRKIYWIPDFQEAFLPELFTPKQIEERKNRQQHIARTADFLIFSSKDSQSHFNKLYPQAKPEQFVLNFAVTHPSLERRSKEEILAKYNLDREYFFTPNQFCIHKNHRIILEAANEIIGENPNVLFVFSGKEHDHRSSEHIIELKAYVTKNKLENNTRFLGFLPREEQLIILRNCKAVIQPSLFEGWSTVVEDAKAQNKFLFLSDLPVHYEQVSENVEFFNRNDYKH